MKILSTTLPDTLTDTPRDRPAPVEDPKAPSGGGEGDVGKSLVVKSKPKTFASVVDTIVQTLAPIIHDTVSQQSEDDLMLVRSAVTESLFDEVDQLEKLIELKMNEEAILKNYI